MLILGLPSLPISAISVLNHLKQAYLILLLSTGILIFVEWLYPRLPLLEKYTNKTRFLDFLSESNRFDSRDSLANIQEANNLYDSTQSQIATDTVAEITDYTYVDLDTFKVPLAANEFALLDFLASLKNEEQSRIAYFGDSQIEGDLVTLTIRRLLQLEYGGSGLGFLPVSSITAGFRNNIIHTFSKDWAKKNIGIHTKTKMDLGMSGEAFYNQSTDVSKTSWVSYQLPQAQKQGVQHAKLLYGKSIENNYVIAKINKSENVKHSLTGTNEANEITLSDSSLIHSIKLDFAISTQTPIFGVSLESEKGVILDNFSLRGNSGLPLMHVQHDVLQAFDSLLDYDLLVFQFGINIVNAGMKDYSWYERDLVKLIQYYQSAFPKASILIIGLADKGMKINGSMGTNPSVKRILKAQYKAALRTGVTFYNLFENMGGEGSMANWADKQKPALANKDYTHFNHKGAEKVGQMIGTWLLNQNKKIYAQGDSLTVN
jgi:lysophospholipase L1-like esterase